MILTAEVTDVQVGFYSLEGLMDEKGNYHVGIPQLTNLKLIQPNRSLKRLESLYDVTFQSATKLKTPLNPKAINAISLKDFEVLLAKLDRKGNVQAQLIRDELVGLSLHQLFCSAFKVKFEEEDRQEFLKLRQITRIDFRPLTDELQRQGFTESWQYGKFVKEFQSFLGIESGTRDQQIREKIGELIKAQGRLTAYMQCGVKPFDAIAKLKSTWNK
jgi:hypothetical protein